jgi:sec-independent protein translocase protein TatB
MFPEVAPTELIVVAIVALVVVGPKDLPVLLRKCGQWLAKIRGLAAEFKSSFSEMARQSELDDLRKEVEALRQAKFDPIGSELKKDFSAIRDHLSDVPKPGLHDWEVGTFNPSSDEPEAAADQVLPEPEPAPKPKRAPKPKAAAEATPAAKTAKPKAPAKKAAAAKAAEPKTAGPRKAAPTAEAKPAAEKPPAKKSKP